MDIDEFKDEMRDVLCSPNLKDRTHSCPTDLFWGKLLADNPNMAKVMEKLLVIPNSNAATERIFSILRYVHTEQRNSLTLSTINSIISLKVNKTTESHVFDFGDEVKKKCKKAALAYNQAHSSYAKAIC